ncbi:MAG: DNA repair protein RadA [Chloroflexi bacterium]|nr:MAG: DNA repair protein RadA [Chloroflexota bacterium]
MAKPRVRYVCQECGSAQPKWMGRCPDCGEWNTLVETLVEDRPASRGPASTGRTERGKPLPLSAIAADGYRRARLPMEEFNRVLGGGLVPGSLILIGGDPGIGKSTLLLQMSAGLAELGTVLYVSGEESAQQIKLRADRLGISADNLYLLPETNMTAILDHVQQLSPQCLVVDSIQTMYLEELQSAPGSVSQVRECAARFQDVAKGRSIPVFLIGHVTKTGAIAGPRVLEHIVDTVLYLEGEQFHTYRLLRSVKNRFGATNEVGIFEMSDTGLQEVPNPSEAFLAERLPNASGSAIAVTMEGTRPLLVEVQALASATSFGNPRRTANGVDFNRLLLIVAVLTRRVGLRLSDQDVFVNVVGGLQIGEPASDLAVAAAIASSVRSRPVAADVALIGEVGLSGEIRTVGHLETRLKEAAKLGFKRCVVPASTRRQQMKEPPLRLLPARSVGEALDLALLDG